MKRFSLLVLMMGFGCLNGQEELMAPVVRPISYGTVLKGKVVEEMYDSLDFKFFVMERDGVQIKMEALDGWRQDSVKAGEVYALKYQRLSEALRLSFYIYREGELFRDFDVRNLGSYADLVRRELGGSAQVLNEQERFQVKNTFFIFDRPYRLVELKYRGGDGQWDRVRDYLVVTGDSNSPLMVIRYAGNPGLFEDQEISIQRALMQATLNEVGQEG